MNPLLKISAAALVTAALAGCAATLTKDGDTETLKNLPTAGAAGDKEFLNKLMKQLHENIKKLNAAQAALDKNEALQITNPFQYLSEGFNNISLNAQVESAQRAVANTRASIAALTASQEAINKIKSKAPIAAIVEEGHVTTVGDVHEYILANGLKILVKEDHRAPIVVSQIWYKVGSSYEANGTTGVAHVLEHMMFKGTHKHGPNEFSRIISANGGRDARELVEIGRAHV